MPVAGKDTLVKVSGASTAFTGEATTGGYGGDPLKYQLNNAAKRVLDLGGAFVVKDGGSPISAAGNWVLDYLFGVIYFNGAYTPAGAITLDGSYLPMLTIASARKSSFSRSVKLFDATVFGNQEVRRALGLVDVDGSIEQIDPITTDLDSGTGGEQSLDTIFTAGTPKLYQYGVGSKIFRAWVNLEELDEESTFDELVVHPVKFKGCAQNGTYTTGASQGWGS